jgi:muramoyltetrapeptide carboxypeptidase
MLASFGREHDPRTLDDFMDVLAGIGAPQEMTYDAAILTPGQAEGVLIGGNMTMLQNILATPYGWDADNAILFLEDLDELVYRLDRMLHHFRYAGKLRGVRAVLIGEMVNVPDGETSFQKPGEKPYGRTIEHILRDNFPADVPLAMNVPCGHGRYLTTLPIGARARVSLAGDKVRLSLPA